MIARQLRDKLARGEPITIENFVIDTISNSNWTEWSTIQGVIARVISKSDEREARGRFEITSTIYSLNCTTRGPITN